MTDAQQPARRLRIVQVIVTPVLMWDDGEELTPGPQAQPISVPLSRLAEVAESLPGEVAQLEAQALATTKPDGGLVHDDGTTKVYRVADGPGGLAAARGGCWLSGSFDSIEQALAAE